MGFTRLRDGRDGLTRNQALYDDVKGHRRSAGTFATEKAADRAWQRHGTLSAYAAVLAGQGRYDVNVIVRVPDRHPLHPQVILLRR
jgi:hypothetical protein